MKKSAVKVSWKKIMRKFAKMEKDCIFAALKEYLKRDINQKDIDKCGRIPHPALKDRYILVYNDIKLGMVKQMLKGKNYTIEFAGGEITF
ncbi:MAG: hypothetical protein GWP19_00815 [Planctomycetia bacterium]|nr:hypothetical protein [Planctomycetia bacterium]